MALSFLGWPLGYRGVPLSRMNSALKSLLFSNGLVVSPKRVASATTPEIASKLFPQRLQTWSYQASSVDQVQPLRKRMSNEEPIGPIRVHPPSLQYVISMTSINIKSSGQGLVAIEIDLDLHWPVDSSEGYSLQQPLVHAQAAFL